MRFSMPSVEQKRDWAKGRSFDTATTVVLSSEAASWLNLRTEVAQTAVSRLGKMFRTMRRPFSSSLRSSVRSPRVRVNWGAMLPT